MTDTITLPEKKEKEEQKTKRQPPYNVILHNDDDHSFDYVIGMLQKLFGYPPERATSWPGKSTRRAASWSRPPPRRWLS